MRLYTCLTLIVAMASLGMAEYTATAKYTTKYDNVDIESVISNERLLTGYVGCLLGTKPCTPDATELRRNLPGALENDCSSCSEAQKKIADRLSHHLIETRPADWELLEAKYDPSGAYRERYLHERDADKDETKAA